MNDSTHPTQMAAEDARYCSRRLTEIADLLDAGKAQEAADRLRSLRKKGGLLADLAGRIEQLQPPAAKEPTP